MPTCIAIVSDLIFGSRIAGTAKQVGTACKVVRSPQALQDALESDQPATVLVDMSCDELSPAEAIRITKSQCPQARVVAFFSHVQTELMEQAKAAGADDVWPRSLFVQRLPKLLEAADTAFET